MGAAIGWFSFSVFFALDNLYFAIFSDDDPWFRLLLAIVSGVAAVWWGFEIALEREVEREVERKRSPDGAA